MWPEYGHIKIEKMQKDVSGYQKNHNKRLTLKYISNEYGYSIQAGIKFLKTL